MIFYMASEPEYVGILPGECDSCWRLAYDARGFGIDYRKNISTNIVQYVLFKANNNIRLGEYCEKHMLLTNSYYAIAITKEQFDKYKILI